MIIQKTGAAGNRLSAVPVLLQGKPICKLRGSALSFGICRGGCGIYNAIGQGDFAAVLFNHTGQEVHAPVIVDVALQIFAPSLFLNR